MFPPAQAIPATCVPCPVTSVELTIEYGSDDLSASLICSLVYTFPPWSKSYIYSILVVPSAFLNAGWV